MINTDIFVARRPRKRAALRDGCLRFTTKVSACSRSDKESAGEKLKTFFQLILITKSCLEKGRILLHYSITSSARVRQFANHRAIPVPWRLFRSEGSAFALRCRRKLYFGRMVTLLEAPRSWRKHRACRAVRADGRIPRGPKLPVRHATREKRQAAAFGAFEPRSRCWSGTPRNPFWPRSWENRKRYCIDVSIGENRPRT